MAQVQDIAKARKVLSVVGGEQFDQPGVAREALEIAIDEWKPGDNLIQVSFEIFMELLDDYERLHAAFVAGIKVMPMKYLYSKIPPQDAEDVAQKARLTVWLSFRDFVALTPKAWNAWVFMAANNKLNSHLLWLYRRERIFDTDVFLDGIDIHTNDRGLCFYSHNLSLEIDRRGWSIPQICTEWIEYENEDAKAAFAAQILAMHQGQSDWIGPTGSKMEAVTGASSRSILHKWWREFIEEVRKREGKS